MNLYLFDHNMQRPYQIRGRDKSQLRNAQVAGMDRGLLDDLLNGFFTWRLFKPAGLVLSESACMTLGRGW